MTDPDTAALYAVPPDGFVAARDALARERRAAGDRAAAAAIKALRRPTVPAWALNLVAREEPDVVEHARAVAQRLRTTQAAALAGQGVADLRVAGEERRAVVRRAVDAATRSAAAAGHDLTAAHRDAVATTVEAALADADIAAEWAAGRLTQAQQSAGFGFAETAASTPATSSRAASPEESPAALAAPPAARSPRPAPAGRAKDDLAGARAPAARPPAPPRKVARKAATPSAAVAASAAEAKARELRRIAVAAQEEVARRKTAAAVAEQAARSARQALRSAQTEAARAELFAATAEQAAWEAGERAR